jgi:anti-anti-sigma factor
MSLTITIQNQPAGIFTVLPCGDITASSVPQLENFFVRLPGPPLQTVVVDFAGVTLIDSTGIGLMIRLRKNLEPRGLVFAMVHLSPAIQRVFDIVHLTQKMHVFSSRKELDNYLLSVQANLKQTQTPP